MTLESGTKLGHYKIDDEIGKGGMGEVYRARDMKLGREVAIKVLPAEFSQDEDRLARLEREARMLAALNHPNIAAIHGLEEADDTRFLVLELVEGDTLADRLKSGPIPVEESLRLAVQFAEALEAAHEKGVIHRDLKPANIKISPGGRVKVLDFGLAKAFVGDSADVNFSNSPTLSMQATAHGLILGTAAYMSPEQARGEATDTRTDVWAFGCVLFEMLTGRQTWTCRTVTDVIARLVATEPDWAALPANLHPRLRFLLERCLEKDAKDRCQGIAEARADIQKAMADPEGLKMRQAPAIAAAPSPVKLPWAVAVLLGVLLVAGAVWTVRQDGPDPITRFSHVLPEGQQFTNPGRPVVALSPDGSRMVYVANLQLHLRSLDTLDSSPIPGTDEVPTAPFFSPDGEWVGYWSGVDGQLKKVALAGGAPISLTAAGNPNGRPQWLADGTIVWGQAEGVLRVSANGGAPETLIDSAGETLAAPQVLSGGKSVLFHVGTLLAGEIAVQSLESGDRTVLFPGTYPTYIPTGHVVYEEQGVLLAVGFDIDALEVTAGPVALVEEVRSGPVQYALSDSGSLAYVPGDLAAGAIPNGILTWVDRNGVRDPLPAPAMPYLHPRLSPDGTRLAVQTIEANGESNIWFYDLAGTTQIQALAGPGNNSRPIWTPDSQRLTFSSDRGGTESIWWQPADGSRPAEPLTEPEEGMVHWPDSWSPDGRTLALTKANAGMTNGILSNTIDQHVWTLSLDDGAEPQFVAGDIPPNESQAGGAEFSPDGRWLAYRSNEGGAHIQLQPFPMTGAVYDIAGPGGAYPMWSRDGSELFYRRAVDTPIQQGPQFIGVDVSLDPSPRFTNERILPIEGMSYFFGYRDYDIAPDGERFLMIVPETEAAVSVQEIPQIHVVLNWLEELKERVTVP